MNNAQNKIMSLPFLNDVTCTSWEDGIQDIPDNSIDMVLTDPPYGMSYQSNRRRVRHKKIENDADISWVNDWCQALKRVCKPDSHVYVFCSWHNVDVFKRSLSSVFAIKNVLVWKKNYHGLGDLIGDYAPQYELIIFSSNGGKKLNGRRSSNINECARAPFDNHPTEKPTKLLAYLIEKSSKIGDVVLDTFAGSFSTARACVETGRNFISFEIDPEYCAIGKRLLSGASVSLFHRECETPEPEQDQPVNDAKNAIFPALSPIFGGGGE